MRPNSLDFSSAACREGNWRPVREARWEPESRAQRGFEAVRLTVGSGIASSRDKETFQRPTLLQEEAFEPRPESNQEYRHELG